MDYEHKIGNNLKKFVHKCKCMHDVQNERSKIQHMEEI